MCLIHSLGCVYVTYSRSRVCVRCYVVVRAVDDIPDQCPSVTISVWAPDYMLTDYTDYTLT